MGQEEPAVSIFKPLDLFFFSLLISAGINRCSLKSPLSQEGGDESSNYFLINVQNSKSLCSLYALTFVLTVKLF